MAKGKYRALREQPPDGDTDDEEYSEGEYEDGEYEDEYDEDAEAEYDDGEYEETGSADGDSLDGEDEDSEDEDAEYEDAEYEDEYDEDEYEDEYEEEEDSDEEEEDSDEEVEPYRAPGAWSALMESIRGRPKAAPASGTEEDRLRVTYVNNRERNIAIGFGIVLLVAAVLLYMYFRHQPMPAHPSKSVKEGILTDRRDAWQVLPRIGITAALVIAAALWRRRAALGFVLLMSGFVLGFLGIFSLVIMGFGIWLIFKALRRPQAASQRGGGARASRSGATSSSRTPATTTSSRATNGSGAPRQIGRNRRLEQATAAESRRTAPPSKRYTPARPARRPAPAPAPEPEPTNRLTAWLRK
jgi:hypothetical protein